MDTRVTQKRALAPIEGDFAVEIPEACLKGGDLPMPPGAKNTMRAGGMTSFDTETPVAEVVAFYKDAMQKAGWKLAEESSYGDTAILEFEKDGRTASVQIGREKNVTRVIVTAE